MIHRTSAPRVHQGWTRDWWAGKGPWAALVGPAPSEASLADRAAVIASAWTHGDSWHDALHPVSRARAKPEPGSLIVLAGQQPVLGGGPALVVHKAATAIALARRASEVLARPVVPVFLLADQDSDSGEIGHVDTFDQLKRSFVRHRSAVFPGQDMFSRSTWDRGSQQSFKQTMSALGVPEGLLGAPGGPISNHPAALIDAALGPHGLIIVEASRLEAAGRKTLARALADPAPLLDKLAMGADRLREVGRAPSFDPGDPRPLVLESREGRRRRIEPDDDQAASRHAAHPDDFSPHAALRPIVQAQAMPVIAQVVGPSELMYLAQARGLHDLFSAPKPLLVPRMEATRVPAALFAELGERLLDDSEAAGGATEATALIEAADRFAQELGARDPRTLPRLERFAAFVRRRALSLAEQPAWHGRAARGMRAMTRPRGRWQDSVLAWLPDAWLDDDPAGYGQHLVSLCRPLDPPVHVIHTYPEA